MSATSDHFLTLLQQAQRDDRKVQVIGGGYSIFGEVLGFEGDDGQDQPVVIKLSDEYNPQAEVTIMAIERIVSLVVMKPVVEPEPTEPASPDQTGPIQ